MGYRGTEREGRGREEEEEINVMGFARNDRKSGNGGTLIHIPVVAERNAMGINPGVIFSLWPALMYY